LKKGDHVYLIDGSGYIFRAYHALPPLTRKSDGIPTGALAGFCNMLWKLLEDTKAGDRPTHLAVIFDAGRISFRHDIFPEYKANRGETPEDLIPQFPLVRDATRAFNVPAIEKEGYEADDLIATYARQAREAGAKVTIVSSDKDLMQLVVDGKVEMLDTMKNKRIGSAEVIERFGVPPDKVIDVQALAGDSTDNVPGVPGIGVKTAAELINTYGDLETLLQRASEIKQPKRRESLIANADKARMSEKLVRLDDGLPVDVSITEFGCCDPDPKTLLPFLEIMELKALLTRAAAKLGVDPADMPKAELPAEAAPQKTSAKKPDTSRVPGEGPGSLGAIRGEEQLRQRFSEARYEPITDVSALGRVIDRAYEEGVLGIFLAAGEGDPVRAPLFGMGLSVAPGEAYYIPFAQDGGQGGLSLVAQGAAPLNESVVLAALKKILEDDSLLKIGHDIKAVYLMLSVRGIFLSALDDVLLLSYVLDCGLHGHGLEELSELHLNHKPVALSDVVGKGRERVTLDKAKDEDVTKYAAQSADIALRLQALIKPLLIAAKRMTVYETLERPMISVLGAMEREGITIDPRFLAQLSEEFAQGMAGLEKQLHKLAGEEFNLGSPKQLGDILFGKLSLPGGRRTKTGAWSTDADILEELAAQGHDIPARILEWRQLSKLKSTYTDALPHYINPKTGRVHTSFALGATSTGRLSSIEPNLQNIPIRNEEGRRIRKAFVAPKGRKLISADYSQIELRLLAHIADVPALRQAFADGVDIHAMTASEMFGVPVKDMPGDVRRRAKAINFGIIYGISAFGLANQLSIPRGEADAYIKKYFERFPGIRAYMDATKEFVRANGYVETIFGRRIHIRDAKSSNPAQRAFGERQAINAPIQGSAADVIRRAMARLPGAIMEAKLDARLLLQVHDELVIEAKDTHADKVAALARNIMEQAALPALQLRVPLVVDARAGANWDEAH